MLARHDMENLSVKLPVYRTRPPAPDVRIYSSVCALLSILGSWKARTGPGGNNELLAVELSDNPVV